MISRLTRLARSVRRRISRTRWLARLLDLPKPGADSDAPGLIILQLDGLSRTQFEAAARERRLPFLSLLTRYGHFELTSFYSGMPSTTPAVQSEVMFGIRSAVPAFSYLDRKSGRIVRMFESECAAAINQRNTELGHPLLVGGHSISNLFAGGSERPRFCSQQMTLDTAKRELHPWRLLLILCLYCFTVLRVLGLVAIEFLVGMADVVKGVVDRHDWRSELKFLGSRVVVCALLRELARINVKLAVGLGSPIIYANFLGYDEQAHRRGPASLFAHWALKGIDGVCRDIYRTARRSNLRDYEIVVFSDHGQEATCDFAQRYGMSVEDAARKAFASGPLADFVVTNLKEHPHNYYLDQRVRHMLRIRRGRIDPRSLSEQELANEIVVTAMGPIGHIYLPVPLEFAGRATYARSLVDTYRVPLVMTRNEDDGIIYAWNSRGQWQLPRDIETVLGEDHPFGELVGSDLETLCDHENAGDLIIFGWTPGEEPVSFVSESGGHGSVGKEEIRGFALIPQALRSAIEQREDAESFTRGQRLHEAAWEFVHGEPLQAEEVAESPTVDQDVRAVNAASQNSTERRFVPSDDRPLSIRVMTYNIHSCIGLDGKLRPYRIADVIANSGADIVCLQEVDMGRARTDFANQSALIAQRLRMHCEFFPVLQHNQEYYGLAILSRFPIHVRRTDQFPPTKSRRPREARGAIWAEIELSGSRLHVINTHLGLRQGERHDQVTALLEQRWLQEIPADAPIIVCGDLNAGPKSNVVTRLTAFLDCDDVTRKQRMRSRTFPSRFPVRQLDHVLYNEKLVCQSIHRVRTPNAMVASDHLPIIAELMIRTNESNGDHPKDQGKPVAQFSGEREC